MLHQIREGLFAPDETRSGRFLEVARPVVSEPVVPERSDESCVSEPVVPERSHESCVSEHVAPERSDERCESERAPAAELSEGRGAMKLDESTAEGVQGQAPDSASDGPVCEEDHASIVSSTDSSSDELESSAGVPEEDSLVRHVRSGTVHQVSSNGLSRCGRTLGEYYEPVDMQDAEYWCQQCFRQPATMNVSDAK
eukprot:4749436-Amphidinium_carterae.1